MKRIAIALLAILYIIPSFSQTLEWHIKANYADVCYMGNNLFKVKNTNGKWGIINEHCETTVEVKYDSITPFVENRALLLDISGQCYIKGIVNENGKIIQTFHNNEIIANNNFCEGMLAYGVPKGQYYLFGYMDTNGKACIEPQFYWAAPFNGGKAVIQHKTKNFGLINKVGHVELYHNSVFKFMSSPVNNRLLIATSSSRGDKVILAELEQGGKLKEIEVLEKGTIVTPSADLKSISCHNGHVYHFDNAMRLISSSTGRKFNAPLTSNVDLPKSTRFNKTRELGGWKIQHSGKTLTTCSFEEITFCSDEYAIVTSQQNKMGVLKLNKNGNITIQNVPGRVEFYHNAAVKKNLAININGLNPKSQVQIGIVGLKENNQEERYNIQPGYNGIYNQEISYFIPGNNYDSEVELPIKVNLYIDGMLYKTETRDLTAVHKKGFEVSAIQSKEYSESDGTSTVRFYVKSLGGIPSSALISVTGATNQKKQFKDNETVKFETTVTVPEEEEKTFYFTVTIKEEGCPSYTQNLKCTIKNYYLQ